MNQEKSKLFIGFITYGKSSAKYLPYFLTSLKIQSFQNYKILAIDATEMADDNLQIIKKNPEIEIISTGVNFGFAKGFNLLIGEAKKQGAELFLALNCDMIFESGMIEKLICAINVDDKIAAVQPKILKWDFENNKKTEIIDSYGLAIDKMHRFFDDGQGTVDKQGFDKSREIFGFTGAAVLLNLKALEDVRYENEYFDELMFMYKEDCDLSYRLRLAGWKILLEPRAVAYHDRTADIGGQGLFKVGLNRKKKNSQLKKWSFLNNLILLYKIKNLPFSFKVKIYTCYYLLGSIVFALIFENYLMKEFSNFKKIKSGVINKRKILKVAVDMKVIEKFMKV